MNQSTELFDQLFAEQPEPAPLPAKVTRTGKLTAPIENGLAYEYSMALALALELLPDEELAKLTVCNRFSERTRWLLGAKCEAEAAERWNRAIDCGRQPSDWLLCILRGDLFLPSQMTTEVQ